jgi:hypothetical protein
VPDGLRRDSIAPNLIQSTYSTKDGPAVDASRRDPHIDGAFRPEWNRNGPNVLSFADQVSNYAALLADLKVFRFESNKFGPSQSASDEQREDRPITFASEAAGQRITEQAFGLINGQPVPRNSTTR